MIVGDTVGPLPKGISHIMRMTLLAPKFGYLDLARKSILLLMPNSRGVSSIRVTTTPAALTPSTPTSLVRGFIRDGGISGYPIIIRGLMELREVLLAGEPAVRPRVGLAPANPL